MADEFSLMNASSSVRSRSESSSSLSKRIVVEPPSDRVIIQTIMRNTREELYHLQGLEVDGDFVTIRTHVRSFLVLTSILSGCFIGFLTSNTKLFTESIRTSSSIASAVINPYIYIFAALMGISITSNFYNLNVTMSKYS